MNDSQRKYILMLLEGLLRSNKKQQLRDVVAKFRTNKNIRAVQRNFLKRLLQSKAGMTMVAFRAIKTLPQRQDGKGDRRANRFEKGLSDFVNRTLRRTFEAFQHQHEEGQLLKKRAVIQLTNCTMAGRKKLYTRWRLLTETHRTMAKCRKAQELFLNLNWTIKSVADNMFISTSSEGHRKEMALLQLFKVYRQGLYSSFARWREVNRVETIRGRLNTQNQRLVVEILRNIVQNGRNARLRRVVDCFKMCLKEGRTR